MLIGCLVCAALFFAPGELRAVTKTWVGSTGNWSAAAKWNPAGVPGATDSVIINAGTATLDVAATIGWLAVVGGSGISGTNNLTVNGGFHYNEGTLNYEGDLTVNGNFYFGVGIIGNGAIGGTITVNGLTTVGPADAYAGHWVRKKTLICNGGMLWLGGNIGATEGGIWRIAPGTTLTETATSPALPLIRIYNNFSGTATFENQGTFIRNGTVPLYIGDSNVGFINSGTFVSAGANIDKF